MRHVPVLSLLLAALALAALPAWLEPAGAEQSDTAGQDRPDAVVHVVDDAYDDGDEEPDRTTVRAGDTVEWRWAADNENRHTVSAFDGSFESSPGCDDDSAPCGHVQRDPFRVTFEDPGRYPYRCRVHGLQMTAMVIVEPAASESPSDSPSSTSSSPSPSQSGSAKPSSSPSARPSPNPSGGSKTPRPSPSSSPSDDETGDPDEAADREDERDTTAGTGGSSRTASGPLAGVRQTFAPGAGRSAGDSSRPASVASPSFEPFPSPSDGSDAGEPSPGDEASDEAMAVDVAVDGSPSALLIGIAIGSVTVSAGAFAKLVLFA